MTNSYKNYSILERMKMATKHAERRDWKEKKENVARKQWLIEKRNAKEEGIGGA